eukprot:gene22267-27230_t
MKAAQGMSQHGGIGGFSSYSFDSHSGAQGTGDSTELDFNMLSEYLFNEEEKFPNWAGLEDFDQGMEGGLNDMQDFSDKEDQSSAEGGKGGGKGKSKDQLDRRRERNRVLARKTRLRKKFFFESLQKQVNQLAAENEMLKSVVKSRIANPSIRENILGNCKAVLAAQPVVSQSSSLATHLLEKADFSLMQAIQAAQRSFVITDPSLPDNPIIFASQGFLDLCGYRLDEVLGRNCRFLQGPDTDPKQVAILRQGIKEGKDTAVCLLNYRADGSTFHNQIFVAALRDAEGRIVNYVGVQVEIKSSMMADNRKALGEAGETSNAESSVSTAGGRGLVGGGVDVASGGSRSKRARTGGLGSAGNSSGNLASCAGPSFIKSEKY